MASVEMKLSVGTITDRGLNPRRTINEDRLLALPDQGLFVVCDGVGGHNSGEVASELVVETFFNAIHGNVRGDREDFIELTLQHANKELHEMAQRDSSLRGMATTVALLWLDSHNGLVAHVGDSRVYRFTQGRLSQVTTDHTVVEDAIRAGQLTEVEAASHPMKHVINRAVGIEPEVEPDFSNFKLNGDDSFLLCSDGITGHITDAEIADLLSLPDSAQAICDELKRRCYDRGAEDNLTAVIVRLGTHHDDDDSTLQKARRKKTGRTQVFKQSRLTAPLDHDQSTVRGTTQLSTAAPKITVPFGNNNADRRDTSRIPISMVRSDERTYNDGPHNVVEPATASLSKRILVVFIVCILLGVSFYVGMWFDQQLAQKKAPTTAKTAADAPLALPTGDPSFNEGALAFNRSDWAAASDSFAQAVKKNPTNGEYQYWFARSKFEQHEYKDALAAFQKAIDSNYKGTKGSCFLYKGLCHTALKQDEEAVQDYRAYMAARIGG